MNQYLQNIQDLLQQADQLDERQKQALLKAIADADKQWNITDFKLDRTEKVKKTTAILLEETISELEQKRKAVEAQNHELEIEAALEKVRSRSLAMHRSDELQEVVHALFGKLKELNVDFYTVIIIIFQENSKDIVWWLENKESQQYPRILLPYSDNPYLRDLFEARETDRELFSKCYSFEGKNELFHYLFKDTDFKYVPENQKKFLFESEFATISVALARNTGIHITSYSKKSFSEKDNEILKRFAKVFDQAYTRFLDLQKAEAQAREAQIEAALERTRTQSMIMQHSKELDDTLRVFHEQVLLLGINSAFSFLWLPDEDKDRHIFWAAWAENIPGEQTIKNNSTIFRSKAIDYPLDRHDPATKQCLVDWKSDEPVHSYFVQPAEVENYFAAWQELIDGVETLQPQHFRDGLYYVEAFMKYGCFGVMVKSELPEAEKKVLSRFAVEFERAYTRFLDLQKAEAQAREAQIEAALERVRSTSLAMHHANELEKVVAVLFEKLSELGLSFSGAGIFLFDKSEREIQHWIIGLDISAPVKNILPHDQEFEKNLIVKDLWLAIEEGEHIINKSYAKNVKDELFQYTSKYNDDSKVPEEVRKFIFEAENFTLTGAAEKNSLVCLDSWSGPFTSEEDFQILKRFARVFDQAYVRFLDLQKAEAQAREAQIETALEKVRSRSLAMHKSDELKDVITVVLEKLQDSGITMQWRAAVIVIIDEGSKSFVQWVASPEHASSISIRTPYFQHPVFDDFWNARETGTEMYTRSYSYEEKNSLFQYQFNNLKELQNLPENEKKWILESRYYEVSVAIERCSAIIIADHSGESLSEKENAILKRFSKVFEQSYVRFLDLQKAEAQARESQIQLALERVRARTMAMQKSDELMAVAVVLFQQLEDLGIKVWTTGFNVWSDDNNYYTDYITSPKGAVIPPYTIDASVYDVFRKVSEAKKRGDEFFVNYEEGEMLKETYRQLSSFNSAMQYQKMLEDGFQFPHHQYEHLVFGSKVSLMFITYEPVPEAHEIFKRLGKAFDQTYTRFLDLQKAEAQARESQIQLALERVRARTMAMQRSDELLETTFLLFQQLKELSETASQLSIGIIKEEQGVVELSATVHGNPMLQTYNVPADEPYVMKKALKAWKEKQKSLKLEIEGQELKDYNNWRNSILEKKIDFPEDKWIVNIICFSKGIMSFSSERQIAKETFQLLERFAGVFDLTYTRFLDLKQAEEQARESQIQLALERVRARTMAMQKSEELNEVAGLLFKQVSELGIKTWTTGFNVWSEDNNSWVDYVTNPQGGFIEPYTLDATCPALVEISDAKKRGDEFFVRCEEGEQLAETYRQLTKFGEKQYKAILDSGFQFPAKQYEHIVFGSKVSLMFITYEPVPEAHDIFRRFGKVFEQTYTRFLDLQKAEAQARESQIQLALERVRARTMAMQKSDELAEVAGLLFKQALGLGIKTWTTGFNVWSEDNYSYTDYITSPQGNLIEAYTIDTTKFPAFIEVADAKKRGEEFWVQYLEGDLLKETYRELSKFGDEKQYEKMLQDGFQFPSHQYDHFVFGSKVSLMFITYEPVPEAHDIFKRFGKVFEQTYTRFLDLQKAEAQARESQIQLALERVRARTMAMQKSNELNDVATLLFKQVSDLGIKIWSTGFKVWSDDNNFWTDYVTNPQGGFMEPYIMDSTRYRVFVEVSDAKKRGDKFFVNYEEGEQLAETYRELSKCGEKQFKAILDSGFQFPSKQYEHHVFGSKVSLLFISYEPVPEAHEIFKRFGKVFEQTYTRFLDLQKAEAQAREAQIEAVLERIRSQSLAMHHSDELKDVIAIMFKKLNELKVLHGTVAIQLFDFHTKDSIFWAGNDFQSEPQKVSLPYDEKIMVEDTCHRDLWEAMTKGKIIINKVYSKEQKDKWFEYVFDKNDLSRINSDTREIILQAEIHTVCFIPEKNSALFADSWDGSVYTEEDLKVLKRAAKVFEQAYIRFLDLQKAEIQAREATIEAALEKVRGKAMAMHNSNDLSATASMVFTELRKLGINPIRCGVGLLTKESLKAQLYSATSSADGDNLALIGWVLLSGHPALESIYQAWMRNEDYFPELSGEQLKSYYEKLLTGLSLPSIPDWKTAQKQFGHFIPFSIGCLYAWSDRHYSDSEIKILKRFAAIIDLTFRRYMELKKSEANAREAVKQAALDRIRADIASMRTVGDLDRITPLIWNELTILNVPFIRCGVFIMDDAQKLIHTFLSTRDGRSIAAFHLPYDTPGNFTQVVNYWRDKKNYINHWGEADFISLADILVKQGAIETREQYLNTLPHGGFYLHFLPFLQGMLYVGNTTQLSEEEIMLIQSVADAFSTAYARYEDFNKLEAAKKQVDKTLVDLRQAQQQLVQSEKMASLGELTAGIAHEIQNPLNFVNNFSEVNTELIDELEQEIDKGNTSEVKAITKDVKQNLEKILHHGKRADAIVKGMLQHSRMSTGKKEPTDVNALCDEYLRLSYHGLRAKDKTFNAKFETDFDASLEKINIIPQDIGRVILNLINNAFYAVSKKKKQTDETLPAGQAGYEPTVSICTKKADGKIEILIKDNGIGINQKVLDKIFQPFFTTKPTGQGTGLGLSLAYDIIKAHGGEIEVKTREGEGSEFIIQLPIA